MTQRAEHGMILNASTPDYTGYAVRAQVPVFRLACGLPVFEVWIWHAKLARWCVLTHAPGAVPAGSLPCYPYRPVLDQWVAYYERTLAA